MATGLFGPLGDHREHVIRLPAGSVGAYARRRAHKRSRVGGLLALIALSSQSREALAQDSGVQNPNDLFTEEAGLGVRVSPGLILHGNAEAQVIQDTNVYNTDALEEDDTIAVVKPTLALQTTFGRHSAELIAGAEIRRHFSITDEDSEQFEVIGRSRLDLGGRLTASTEVFLAEKIELRGTAGDAFATDRPIEYSERRGRVQIARTGGILELIGGISLTAQEFDRASVAGTPLDLSFRDVKIGTANLRANYRLSEKFKLFTEVTGNQVRYDLDGAASRDSDGFAAVGGFQFNPSPLVNVEAAVGLIHQNFNDPTIPSTTGLNYFVNAKWFPSPQWQLTATGQRTVDPGPVSFVPAIVRSTFDLRATRALGDRVLVEAGIGFTREDYTQGQRNDDRYMAEVAVRYRITDRIGATAFVGYRRQDSSVADESYEGVGLGASVRFML